MEKATGRVITLTTNKEGYFVARSLSSGGYSVKVEQTASRLVWWMMWL